MLSQHLFQFFLFVIGITYTILLLNRKRAGPFISIFYSAFMVYIMYRSQHYASMTIYIYASIMSMITFKTWSGQERFIPHWETKKDLGKFSIGAIALFFVIYYILRFKLAAPSPVLDAMHFTLKIGAYIFTARKSIESLLCFVVGDIIMVGMFAYTQQFILSSSYVVYVIIQFKGFLDWKKIIDNNKL